MEESKLVANEELVAHCGLYCGACRSYLKGKCPGCKENEKATWCKIRSCCIENNYKNCSECKMFENPNDCKKFNNFISKVFGFVFNSNRAACIDRIKEVGEMAYATEMAANKRQSLPRK